MFLTDFFNRRKLILSSSILNCYMNIVFTNMRSNINFVSGILRHKSDLMHTTRDVLVPSLHVHVGVL